MHMRILIPFPGGLADLFLYNAISSEERKVFDAKDLYPANEDGDVGIGGWNGGDGGGFFEGDGDCRGRAFRGKRRGGLGEGDGGVLGGGRGVGGGLVAAVVGYGDNGLGGK